jgi:conjugative transposon TraJ protein
MRLTKFILSVALLCLPAMASAQDDFAGEIHSLQSVLDQLYDEMIPLCSQLIGVGRGIAGFAALFYIAYRVWRSIANAEPIDFYPLLRPFAIGLAIILFPHVIALINGVLKPTVTGTAAMMKNSNKAIAYLLKKKEQAINRSEMYELYGMQGEQSNWYKYQHPEGEEESGGLIPTIGIRMAISKALFSFKNSIKRWLSEILHIVYEAAALCINTIRTFYLIVLAILGPLVFAISIFDGFQHTLAAWFARYINVFLWLPVANIFGAIIAKIQENMLRIDLAQIEQYGDTFFSSSDVAYLIFLIIGIIGYFTVPSVANYIIHAAGGHALLSKTTTAFQSPVHSAASNAASAVTKLAGKV